MLKKVCIGSWLLNPMVEDCYLCENRHNEISHFECSWREKLDVLEAPASTCFLFVEMQALLKGEIARPQKNYPIASVVLFHRF